MSGYIEVTKEQFFAYIGPRDIVLRTERKETFWETRNRTVVGRTTPGYLCEGEKGYFLTDEAFTTLKASS